MLNEAEHLVAVTVLVVVPAHDLHEVVVQGDKYRLTAVFCGFLLLQAVWIFLPKFMLLLR